MNNINDVKTLQTSPQTSTVVYNYSMYNETNNNLPREEQQVTEMLDRALQDDYLPPSGELTPIAEEDGTGATPRKIIQALQPVVDATTTEGDTSWEMVEAETTTGQVTFRGLPPPPKEWKMDPMGLTHTVLPTKRPVSQETTHVKTVERTSLPDGVTRTEECMIETTTVETKKVISVSREISDMTVVQEVTSPAIRQATATIEKHSMSVPGPNTVVLTTEGATSPKLCVPTAPVVVTQEIRISREGEPVTEITPPLASIDTEENSPPPVSPATHEIRLRSTPTSVPVYTTEVSPGHASVSPTTHEVRMRSVATPTFIYTTENSPAPPTAAPPTLYMKEGSPAPPTMHKKEVTSAPAIIYTEEVSSVASTIHTQEASPTPAAISLTTQELNLSPVPKPTTVYTHVVSPAPAAVSGTTQEVRMSSTPQPPIIYRQEFTQAPAVASHTTQHISMSSTPKPATIYSPEVSPGPVSLTTHEVKISSVSQPVHVYTQEVSAPAFEAPPKPATMEQRNRSIPASAQVTVVPQEWKSSIMEKQTMSFSPMKDQRVSPIGKVNAPAGQWQREQETFVYPSPEPSFADNVRAPTTRERTSPGIVAPVAVKRPHPDPSEIVIISSRYPNGLPPKSQADTGFTERQTFHVTETVTSPSYTTQPLFLGSSGQHKSEVVKKEAVPVPKSVTPKTESVSVVPHEKTVPEQKVKSPVILANASTIPMLFQEAMKPNPEPYVISKHVGRVTTTPTSPPYQKPHYTVDRTSVHNMPSEVNNSPSPPSPQASRIPRPGSINLSPARLPTVGGVSPSSPNKPAISPKPATSPKPIGLAPVKSPLKPKPAPRSPDPRSSTTHKSATFSTIPVAISPESKAVSPRKVSFEENQPIPPQRTPSFKSSAKMSVTTKQTAAVSENFTAGSVAGTSPTQHSNTSFTRVSAIPVKSPISPPPSQSVTVHSRETRTIKQIPSASSPVTPVTPTGQYTTNASSFHFSGGIGTQNVQANMEENAAPLRRPDPSTYGKYMYEQPSFLGARSSDARRSLSRINFTPPRPYSTSTITTSHSEVAGEPNLGPRMSDVRRSLNRADMVKHSRQNIQQSPDHISTARQPINDVPVPRQNTQPQQFSKGSNASKVPVPSGVPHHHLQEIKESTQVISHQNLRERIKSEPVTPDYHNTQTRRPGAMVYPIYEGQDVQTRREVITTAYPVYESHDEQKISQVNTAYPVYNSADPQARRQVTTAYPIHESQDAQTRRKKISTHTVYDSQDAEKRRQITTAYPVYESHDASTRRPVTTAYPAHEIQDGRTRRQVVTTTNPVYASPDAQTRRQVISDAYPVYDSPDPQARRQATTGYPVYDGQDPHIRVQETTANQEELTRRRVLSAMDDQSFEQYQSRMSKSPGYRMPTQKENENTDVSFTRSYDANASRQPGSLPRWSGRGTPAMGIMVVDMASEHSSRKHLTMPRSRSSYAGTPSSSALSEEEMARLREVLRR